MEPERQCFESDEDGHWYLIKEKDRKLFDKLLEADYEDYTGKFEEKFDGKRLNMHLSNYTFIDCKEAK